MPQPAVDRILVPDATRKKLLVVDGAPPTLPSLTHEEDEFVESIREARRTLGLTAPFLRVVRSEGRIGPEHEVRTLIEFDAPNAAWRPTRPLRWLPFADVAARLDADSFAADVARWVDEVSSGSLPALRPSWARPGWFEATTARLTEELAASGRTVTGPVEQLGGWAISSLLAVDTDSGRVIHKSVPALFGHEPALTRALAAAHPDRVPEVLVAGADDRQLMMAAFGGTPLGADDPSRWGDGLVAMAEIQRAWIGRRAEADAIGLPDRSLQALEAELASIVTDESASAGLSPEDRGRLIANLPIYRELIDSLRDGPVPETLVHADLHPWNVQRDGDRIVIFDWSDACWSYPFFDVPTFTVRTEDGAAREAMTRAYLAAWSDFAAPDRLRELLAWAAPLTELHLAITWRRLRAIFEPEHGYDFVENGVQRHLELALKATPTATTRSSP